MKLRLHLFWFEFHVKFNFLPPGSDLLRLEQYREAVKQFTEALTFHCIPEEIKENIHWLRALAYSNIGLNRDAIKDCSIAKRSVSSKNVLKLRAKCYSNMRDFENCVNDYSELCHLKSTTEHITLLNEAQLQLHRFQSNNYYDILDIEKNATSSNIKRAYKNLSLIHHPDKHSDASDSEKRKQEEIFKRIQFAFQVLSDPVQKTAYDVQNYNSSQ